MNANLSVLSFQLHKSYKILFRYLVTEFQALQDIAKQVHQENPSFMYAMYKDLVFNRTESEKMLDQEDTFDYIIILHAMTIRLPEIAQSIHRPKSIFEKVLIIKLLSLHQICALCEQDLKMQVEKL